MPAEIESYLRWKGESMPELSDILVVQEKKSGLDICDADTEVIFESEKRPLTIAEYEEMKQLVLKSARDFLRLYEMIPDKGRSCVPDRHTFYGQVPRTANEMYEHTKNVNAYYFGEIGVEADNSGTIVECRQRGFELLERQSDFLNNHVVIGSYEEEWSLRKVLRRFVWHDRIHSKAMYRMAVKTFGREAVPDIFFFGAD